MRLATRLIERYVLAAVLPYAVMALLLLTTLLLAQQIGRFAEALGTVRAPLWLAGEIALGLIPNVLVFTLPLALLAGILIGFSRMGSDSELIAMRAAGVGRKRALIPVLLLAALLSLLALYIGLEHAPAAAQRLRRALLQVALDRLESPIEPRSFNTELPGKIIYVREGDETRGEWENVFIHAPEGNTLRLITAQRGRIDSAGENAELVLSDTVAMTLPAGGMLESSAQIVMERSAQLRVRLDVGRKALIEAAQARRFDPIEMSWRELLAGINAARTDPEEQRKLSTALHKRISLGIAPFVFAVLGVGLGWAIRRGGRGIGLLLSIAAMAAYYLLLIAGESLALAGTLPPALGGHMAALAALSAGCALLMRGDRRLWGGFGRYKRGHAESREEGRPRSAMQTAGFQLLGLLDRRTLGALTYFFGASFAALLAVYLIFTLFETWRFAAAAAGGWRAIGRYLLYLVPLASVVLAPMGVLVATLATYALMARRSEAVAWLASGQSIYRLALPCMLFALLVCGGTWLVQERWMPGANRRQDALRAQLRGGGARVMTSVGWQWLALTDENRTTRLFFYEYDEAQAAARGLVIYEFTPGGAHLRRIIQGEMGLWSRDGEMEVRSANILEETAHGWQARAGAEGLSVPASQELFKPTLNKPAHMSSEDLSAYMQTLNARGETDLLRPMRVALWRKRADPVAPLVLALLAFPLALGAGRRSNLTAIGAAIIAGITFWLTTTGFQQMGSYGLLPPPLAATAPPLVFAALGIYMLSRART